MILLFFSSAGRSVPHFHIFQGQRAHLSPHWVLASCGRIWFAGDGAFAPEAWVGSAIQPYPFFSIRADSRDSRASPTYSHGRGLPWLQLKAGRRGNSHGGAEAQRGNEHCPNLTLLPMILPSMILLFSLRLGVSPTYSHISGPVRSFFRSFGLGDLREDLVCGRRRIRT
jgi:hypothetical protein